jgi:hypothetical protein
MAQLSPYTLNDYYLIILVTTLFASYLAEELEVTVEASSAHIYSSF